jgi:hypothetical protein
MNIKSFLKSDVGLISFFALIKLLTHLYTNAFAGYGIFRDEFYYLASVSRLDMGYPDHPPLSIYILAVSKFLFGDSQFGIRLVPAFTSAFIVFITGLLVRKTGGGRFAIFLACISVIFSPILIGMPGIFSMNVFDHLFWILAAYFIILLIKELKSKYWIYLGIVLGLGLLNKVGVLWLCTGVFFGIIFTPLRSFLKTKYPYITAAIAFVLFLPFIIWNITHDFAHIEFIRNASQMKYGGLTRIGFVTDQFLLHNPFSMFVWLPGLYFFFFNKEGRTFRILGIIYLVSFLILFINGKSKGEYLAAAYPMLFAGGGVIIEKFILIKKQIWIKYALPSFVIIGGVIIMPFALPILPVETFISYSKVIGIGPSTPEGHELSELPQFYADMFGWEEMASTVSKVYQSLPDDEKERTIVFASNYGRAGSLEYYSKKYSLPKVVSPHNSYWFWGLKDFQNFTTAIVIGGNADEHKKSCEEVTEAGFIKSRYAIPYENNLPVYICRKIKRPLEEIWRASKIYI